MPKYRAKMYYTDDQRQEHCKTIEIDAESDSSEDIARAAQESFRGFQQEGEERLPHNIEWERLE